VRLRSARRSCTYLLFLVLGICGHKKGQIPSNPPFIQEPLKLFLDIGVEMVKLKRKDCQSKQKQTTILAYLPEDQCTVLASSNQHRMSTPSRASHPCRMKRYRLPLRHLAPKHQSKARPDLTPANTDQQTNSPVRNKPHSSNWDCAMVV
jgi:hypothetical protein